jgi:site-specific recombinase XerD
MRPDPSLVRVSGPLAEHAVAFGEELLRRDYPPGSAARHVRLLAQLSRWMEREGLGERDLSEERVAVFLAARRAEGYYYTPSSSSVLTLLGCVPGLDVARGEPAPLTPLDSAVAEYAEYLTRERGLAPGTVRGYREVAKLFCSRWATPDGALELSQVDAKAVIAFVVEQARRRSVGSAQVLVTAMRSLLRYLFLEGRIAQPLAQAVPAVSAPKGFLPRGLGDEVLSALLKSCDASTVIGRRDLAVLTLCSRLGLRAGEVAGLALDDIDWHHGELVVRGKGSRRDRLPLPVDVGEALAAYLSDGRPPVASRTLFLRMHAPIGAMCTSNVTMIVRRACERAGVAPAGAHRLRHSTATAMLRHGASLREVGQVLRHNDDTVTAIYAKVDRVALRTLAQPWPGATA